MSMFGRRDGLTASASDLCVGEGTFWKKGSAFRSWKRRAFKIRKNGSLSYYDMKTQGLKGSFNISKVKVSFGAVENVWELESDVPADAISIDLFSYEEVRNMELVFCTKREVRIFCRALANVSSLHNIMVRT